MVYGWLRGSHGFTNNVTGWWLTYGWLRVEWFLASRWEWCLQANITRLHVTIGFCSDPDWLVCLQANGCSCLPFLKPLELGHKPTRIYNLVSACKSTAATAQSSHGFNAYKRDYRDCYSTYSKRLFMIVILATMVWRCNHCWSWNHQSSTTVLLVFLLAQICWNHWGHNFTIAVLSTITVVASRCKVGPQTLADS